MDSGIFADTLKEPAFYWSLLLITFFAFLFSIYRQYNRERKIEEENLDFAQSRKRYARGTYNEESRRKLLEKIIELFDPYDVRQPNPVVSLEDFFTGNNDPRSIGAELIPHPGVNQFHRILLEIRSRDDVQDVLVRIEKVDDLWPYSDVVYVITSAPIEEVKAWFIALRPSGVREGHYSEKRLAPDLDIEPGMRIVLAGWG